MSRPSVRRFALALLVVHVSALTAPCFAGPDGGVVAGGIATIDQSVAGQTTITQATDRAIINWSSFSTASNEAVRFAQPGATAVTLNRVTGASASTLDGALTANGRVFLLNPNGILFGANARVDVGGLVASTLAMTDGDFMNGRYRLEAAAGRALAPVVNKGSILAGSVALVAPVVSNQGAITAPGGRIALAAGNRAEVSLDANQLVTLSVSTEAPRDVSLPREWADDALATAVNNDHLVSAGSVSVREGVVTLGGAEGLAHAGGVISADAAAAGGRGGDVRVLGAQAAYAQEGARLSARGGEGGEGGFIEVSAARILPRAQLDATAPGGESGTILFDPVNLRIIDGSTAGEDLSKYDINSALLGGDVTIEADNSIKFDHTFLDETAITNGGTGHSLTFRAHGGGGIFVDPTQMSPGSIDISGGGTLTLQAPLGPITLFRGVGLGGTDVHAHNLFVNAGGPVMLGFTETTGPAFVQSSGGGVGVGSDAMLRAPTINLIAAGNIVNESGGAVPIDSQSGAVNLSASGPDRAIRVDDLAVMNTLFIQTNLTLPGASSIAVRGNLASQPVSLEIGPAAIVEVLTLSNGVLSGNLSPGSINVQNGGPAAVTVDGLIASALVMNSAGPISVGASGLLATSGSLTISSADDISIAGPAHGGSLVSMFAGSDLFVSGSITSRGPIDLRADGNFVSNGSIVVVPPMQQLSLQPRVTENPISIDADGTLIAGGMISSDSFVDLTCGGSVVLAGLISAPGDVFVAARGSIRDGNGPSLNLSAQTATMFAGGVIGADDPIEVSLSGKGMALFAKGTENGVSARIAGSAAGIAALDATGPSFFNGAPALRLVSVLSTARFDAGLAAEVYGTAVAAAALDAIARQDRALARSLLRFRVVGPGESAPMDLAGAPAGFSEALALDARLFAPTPAPVAPVAPVEPPPAPAPVAPPPPAPEVAPEPALEAAFVPAAPEPTSLGGLAALFGGGTSTPGGFAPAFGAPGGLAPVYAAPATFGVVSAPVSLMAAFAAPAAPSLSGGQAAGSLGALFGGGSFSASPSYASYASYASYGPATPGAATTASLFNVPVAIPLFAAPSLTPSFTLSAISGGTQLSLAALFGAAL